MPTNGGQFETLDENLNVKISSKSRHRDIRLAGVFRHWFESIVPRLVTVSFPSHLDIVGTASCLYGDTHDDVVLAQNLFLYFTENSFLENERNRRIFNS